jgi:hypothetical protein
MSAKARNDGWKNPMKQGEGKNLYNRLNIS